MCPFPFSFYYATGGDNSGNPMPLPSVLIAGGRGHSPKGGDCLKVEITEKEKAAIEKAVASGKDIEIRRKGTGYIILEVSKKIVYCSSD